MEWSVEAIHMAMLLVNLKDKFVVFNNFKNVAKYFLQFALLLKQ
jgi:hypothetical protein